MRGWGRFRGPGGTGSALAGEGAAAGEDTGAGPSEGEGEAAAGLASARTSAGAINSTARAHQECFTRFSIAARPVRVQWPALPTHAMLDFESAMSPKFIRPDIRV